MIRRLGAVCLLFSSAASAQDAPAARRVPAVSPFGAAKARGLMRDRLPCAGCHAFGGSGGRIGPDLSRVHERRSPAYIRRMIEDPGGAVPGTVMPKVPMPRSTRELIVAYLGGDASGSESARRDGVPVASIAGRAEREAAAPDARTLYGRYCAACHGARGRGDGPNAAHLPVRPARHADPVYMSGRSDDRLFDAIYAGGYPLGRSATMPPYGATLARPEIWALVAYLRQLCKCAGPAWSTDGDRPRRGRKPP